LFYAEEFLKAGPMVPVIELLVKWGYTLGTQKYARKEHSHRYPKEVAACFQGHTLASSNCLLWHSAANRINRDFIL
jgi:hypothetical protein